MHTHWQKERKKRIKQTDCERQRYKDNYYLNSRLFLNLKERKIRDKHIESFSSGISSFLRKRRWLWLIQLSFSHHVHYSVISRKIKNCLQFAGKEILKDNKIIYPHLRYWVVRMSLNIFCHFLNAIVIGLQFHFYIPLNLSITGIHHSLDEKIRYRTNLLQS